MVILHYLPCSYVHVPCLLDVWNKALILETFFLSYDEHRCTMMNNCMDMAASITHAIIHSYIAYTIPGCRKEREIKL